MNWLKFVNVFIFQWFFIRLTRIEDKGENEFCFTYYYWYSIQYFIVPLTGWWNEFVWLENQKFYQLTKKKIKVSNNKKEDNDFIGIICIVVAMIVMFGYCLHVMMLER